METDADEKKVHPAGLLFGLGLAASCVFVALQSWEYGLGSFRRMGPGLLPFMLGLVGILLGLAMAWRSVRSPLHEGAYLPIRRLIFIGAAFVFFALAIEPVGLMGTLFCTTIIGAFADADALPTQTLALAAGLTATIWLVFVYLLGLAIPLWPNFL